MENPDILANKIKDNFISSMIWSKEPNIKYNQEDVKTIVLGNINSLTYLFSQAFKKENEKNQEDIKDIILHIIHSIDKSNGNLDLIKEYCNFLLKEREQRSGRWQGTEKTECGIHIKRNSTNEKN